MKKIIKLCIIMNSKLSEDQLKLLNISAENEQIYTQHSILMTQTSIKSKHSTRSHIETKRKPRQFLYYTFEKTITNYSH